MLFTRVYKRWKQMRKDLEKQIEALNGEVYALKAQKEALKDDRDQERIYKERYSGRLATLTEDYLIAVGALSELGISVGDDDLQAKVAWIRAQCTEKPNQTQLPKSAAIELLERTNQTLKTLLSWSQDPQLREDLENFLKIHPYAQDMLRVKASWNAEAPK